MGARRRRSFSGLRHDLRPESETFVVDPAPGCALPQSVAIRGTRPAGASACILVERGATIAARRSSHHAQSNCYSAHLAWGNMENEPKHERPTLESPQPSRPGESDLRWLSGDERPRRESPQPYHSEYEREWLHGSPKLAELWRTEGLKFYEWAGLMLARLIPLAIFGAGVLLIALSIDGLQDAHPFVRWLVVVGGVSTLVCGVLLFALLARAQDRIAEKRGH